MFLSCRPFVAITTLSTGLVGVEVTTVESKGKLILSASEFINHQLDYCSLSLRKPVYQSADRNINGLTIFSFFYNQIFIKSLSTDYNWLGLYLFLME